MKTTYFLYSVASETEAFNIVSTKMIDENQLTDILWDSAPFRCNVCDMETLTLDEVMEECETYDNTSFYVSDTSKGWENVKEMVATM